MSVDAANPTSGTSRTTVPTASATRPDVTVRMTWMDVLRGIAVLAVVLFHAGTLLRFADAQVPAGMSAVNHVVAPFRIPMLVLLSGLLLPRSMSKGSARYAAGKAAAIGWPFLLWSAVYGLVRLPEYGLPAVKWLVPSLLLGGSYLWYLFFLVVFYAAALVLRRVPRLPAAIGFLVVAEFMPDDTKYGERLTFLFALFLVGWWVAERPALLGRGLRSPVALAVAGVVVLASYLVLDMSGYGPRAVPGTLAGVFLLAALAQRCSGAAVLRPLRFVGRNSVVYYVVHFTLILLVMTGAAALGITVPWLLVTISLLAALGVGTVLALARGRSAVVAGLFVAPAWLRTRVLARPRRRAAAV